VAPAEQQPRPVAEAARQAERDIQSPQAWLDE